MTAAGPAKRPCGSCPYRRDVPSGVWSEDEYDKLPDYDLPTAFQPTGAFFCHQQNGRLCAGWVGCHDMDESLALRIAASVGIISTADVEAARAYESPVPLWGSGTEAAEHGRAEIATPSAHAKRVVERLTRKQERRGAADDPDGVAAERGLRPHLDNEGYEIHG